MSGWFAVKHGIAEHPAFRGNWERVGWFVWMVDNAAYQPTDIEICGRSHTVPRGALCYSQRFLAEKFKTSTKSLRTFLDDLERHKVVTLEVATTGQGTKTKRTQITLCNYSKYQDTGNKMETRRKQDGNEEQQYNNIPVGTDQNPSSELVDFEGVKAMAWRSGSAYLSRHGVKNPRPLIGKWLKDTDATGLLAAIEAAQREDTQDPVPFITKIIANSGKKMAYGRPVMTNIEYLEAAL